VFTSNFQTEFSVKYPFAGRTILDMASVKLDRILHHDRNRHWKKSFRALELRIQSNLEELSPE